MFRSTPEGPLVREAGLVPAKILLDNRQRTYACRLLSLPQGHPTKDILPMSLVSGDGAAQPGEQPDGDIDWAIGEGRTWLGYHLARKIAMGDCIDPAEGVEPIVETRPDYFPGVIHVENTETATKTAKDPTQSGLVLWSDGSKLETGGTGAAVVWNRDENWSMLRTTLGKNNEIFDAELWGVSDALKVALEVAHPNEAVTVFIDSQAAIQQIRYLTGGGGQAITLQIYRRALELQRKHHPVTLRWVPGHANIEGNERADKAAKEAASGLGRRTARWSSLAHVRRSVTQTASTDSQQWLHLKMQILRGNSAN
jgi:ribonuclease HI